MGLSFMFSFPLRTCVVLLAIMVLPSLSLTHALTRSITRTPPPPQQPRQQRRRFRGIPPERLLDLIETGAVNTVAEAVELVRRQEEEEQQQQRLRRAGRRRRVGYEMLRDGGSLQEVAKFQKSTSNNNRTRTYNFHNFYRRTGAEFTACHPPPPDRAADYTSPSGSVYWDQGTHVVRQSNHWTGKFGVYRLKDCLWTIDVEQNSKTQILTGQCAYASFLPLRPFRKKKKKS